MGILNLTPQLKECHGPTVPLSQIFKKTIAIDTSILTVQFLKGNDDAIERFHMSPRIPYFEILTSYFLKKIEFFKQYECKLIWVLDGSSNPLKLSTNISRKQKSNDKYQQLLLAYQQNEVNDKTFIKNLKRDSTAPTDDIIAELVNFFIVAKQHFIISPVEADSQLIYLQVNGIVDIIYTIDSERNNNFGIYSINNIYNSIYL